MSVDLASEDLPAPERSERSDVAHGQPDLAWRRVLVAATTTLGRIGVAVASDCVRGMTVDEAAAAGSTVRGGRNHATRQVTAPLMEPTIFREVCHD